MEPKVLFRKGKETMRRLLGILMSTGLLGISFGCNHMHGVCDCDVGPHGYGPPPAVVPVKPGVKPEPIKEMPKVSPTSTTSANEQAG